MLENELATGWRFQEALVFALTHHAGQVRKGTEVPYVTHPVAVAELLTYYYPGNHELAIAGLLHDVVEDTHATIEVVAPHFGERVATLVRAVSKPEASVQLLEERVARWKAQRLAMLDSLAGLGEEAFRLKAADALVNLQAIRRDLRNPDVGARVWSRFKVGREDSLWYYHQIVHALEAIADEPLYRDLSGELSEVEGLAAGKR